MLLPHKNHRDRQHARLASLERPAKFRHDALDLSDPASIRVVHVKRHKCNGLIQCTIRRTNLSSGYIALSYVWGSPDKQELILLNNRPHLVHRNLHQFLSYASTDLVDKSIWIDAICINQQDTNEKNHQVQMMSRIYSKAKAVLAWLGSGLGEADRILRQLNALSTMKHLSTDARAWLFRNCTSVLEWAGKIT